MIYSKVKQACADRGETIIGLEEKLGFPRGSIYKWDENIPSVLKVQKVAAALDKPIEYFLTEGEE